MSYPVIDHLPSDVVEGLLGGSLVPYIGPEVLSLCADVCVPTTPLALAQFLAGRSSVPGKIRNRVTAVAQFIENFKHRKTLVGYLDEAFDGAPVPSALHRWLAQLPSPLIVDTWYDGAMRAALAGRTDWAEVQGLSQSEHFGTWTGWYTAAGEASPDAIEARTVLYKPWGARAPASNYLASDTDFVEVLTEIDIQTPIPALVQARRASLGFVFFGCRFNDQLPRAFARQILKRAGGPHFAVLPEEPTRMEARFLAEVGITRIALPLAQVAAQLTTTGAALPA